MKVALIHDWVIPVAGAERCLEAFHDLYPEAPLHTLVYREDSVKRLGFSLDQVHASFLRRFPRATRWYQKYLPLFPLAVEQFDLTDFNVILSGSHVAAKGVLTRSDQLHICYCYTPVRYAWDLTHSYLRENKMDRGLKSWIARTVLHYYRVWDVTTANRVDEFVAISRYVAQRIWRTYRREATVIYPPVSLERFTINSRKDDYFLFVSRLVPYKKADMVIRAFSKIGLRLLVVGDGPQRDECRKLAGRNVEFLGYQTDEEIASLMAKARALVFAAEEDFGIVPVEAQACGTPVIAFGRGGALETVIAADGQNWDAATGLFFLEQTPQALERTVRQFISLEDKFRPEVIRTNAERFGKERFKKEINELVSTKWMEFTNRSIK